MADGGAATPQNLLLRRMVAGAFAVLVLIALVFLVRACNNSRHKDALSNYNRQVSNIATESRQNGAEFFQAIGQGGTQSPQDLYAQIVSYKNAADTSLAQARKLSVPDEMKPAQQSLLIALELRRDGLESIAGSIKTALGDEGDAADRAIRSIAGQMRAFDASDVLYDARVIPFIRDELTQADFDRRTTIQPSVFMRDISWVAPSYVASKLGQQLSSTGDGGSRNEPTGPGVHGTGLDATSYGDVTLQSGASNRLTYAAGQQFSVSFTNQGDNDEFNIKVTVKIARDTGEPLTLTKTLPRVAKGEKATVTLPLNRPPPLDTVVTITTTVAGVPGEKIKDNNTASYPSLFVRG